MGIANQIKTTVLLSVLSLLLLFIGSFFGESGLIFGLVFAILMNFGSYFYSDKIILKMYKAKEVTNADYPKLYRSVKEISGKASIPMPKVYIIPSSTPNAFATGRDPKHSAVACTDGIINILSDKELRAVLAHEIGHIKNRDVLISTIAATIASVISYIAMIARWGAIFGGFGGRDNNGGNIIELLVLAIVAPLTATIIQLAISRSREFLEDEESGKLTGEPEQLASALEKIEGSVKQNPLRFGNQATASLFITNPFRAKGFVNLFSTHPSTEARVKRLRNMKI